MQTRHKNTKQEEEHKETPSKSVSKSKTQDSAQKSISKKKTKIFEEHQIEELQDMANVLRILSVEMTQAANSGHPTSCASCADFMAALFFDKAGMHYDPKHPEKFTNDRLILSKGHAAPILYAAWSKAGYIPKEKLQTLRRIDSNIEGHPTPDHPFVDVATGSLGQGLGVACGMAYSSKYFDKINNTYFVILGDGEIGEGSVWEAAQFAAAYQLDNLIAIVDCNKFGQSNELGHPIDAYTKRFQEFGWFAQKLNDGHDMTAIVSALEKARNSKNKPSVIIGKTFKGRNYGPGIEDNMKYHGKPLGDDAPKALDHLKSLIKNPNVELTPTQPDIDEVDAPQFEKVVLPDLDYEKGKQLATRQGYGNALKRLGGKYKSLIGLDADLKNSTFSEYLKLAYPEQFVECFICEQNMVSVASGIACRRKITFSSTFACFFSRAFDQIRMAGISKLNQNFCGSHAGCSIGEDGTSQMGLEDLALFRSIPNSVVLYPTDAVSAEKAVELAANYNGIAYIRTCRVATNVIYDNNEKFEIGHSKVARHSDKDKVCLVGAGVTFYECQKAADILQKDNIFVRVIDLFSVKPIDHDGLLKNAIESNNILVTVEDHYRQGGIFESVAGSFASNNQIQVHGICVDVMPKSGKTQENLQYCKIDADSIVAKIRTLVTQ